MGSESVGEWVLETGEVSGVVFRHYGTCRPQEVPGRSRDIPLRQD